MGIKSNRKAESYYNYFGSSGLDAVIGGAPKTAFGYYHPYGSPTAKTYLEPADDFNTKTPGDLVLVMLGAKSSIQTLGWGAGGQLGSDPTSYGGGAGAWDGTMSFPAGSTHRIIIGGSGASPTDTRTASPYGGGGEGSPGGSGGGAGGGYSGIFETDTLSQANARLMAAGGGGANGSDAGTFASYGGYGGYPSGNRGTSPSTPAPAAAYGGSGTPTAGGAGGSTPGNDGTAGTALQGGARGLRSTNEGSGGGGGGGYYGGGGGGAGGYGGSSQSGTAGGGGSGYKHPTITATMYSGSGSTGGNPTSPHKGTDVGDHQDPGRVVILFSA